MEIKIKDIVISYKKKGTGTPLLLLHGNGEDHSIFDKLGQKLYKHFTVYAIDSRNHGKSSKTDDFSYETLALDIQAFINQLELKKVNILGFSDGAITAILLAMDSPELINKLVLAGINFHPSDFKKNILNKLKRAYTRKPRPLIKMMLEQPNIDTQRLKNVHIPCFLLAGEKDIFYRKTYQNAAKLLPNAQLQILKDEDHESYIVNNDMLFPIIKDFLD